MEIQNYVIRHEVRNNEDNSSPGTANKSLQTEGTRAYQEPDSSNICSRISVDEKDKSKSTDAVNKLHRVRLTLIESKRQRLDTKNPIIRFNEVTIKTVT